MDRDRLVQMKVDELMQLKNELAPEGEQVPDANNSLLVDDNTSQKLSQAYLLYITIHTTKNKKKKET